MQEHDPEVIYDFDDLFDPNLFEDGGMSLDKEGFMVKMEELEEDNTNLVNGDQPPPNKKRKGQPTTSKPMTKTQFYKIRPRMPKIAKGDARRMLSVKFVEAYNSCDFDTIYDFVFEHSIPDVLFIYRWVGEELYLNFPSYLEVRGIDNVAEYWFSRCVITPDLVIELKETKLYARSDGLSTIRCSFTGYCTRLYDGVISDSLICEPALKSKNNSGSFPIKTEAKPTAASSSSSSETKPSNPNVLRDRVMEKFVKILLHCEPIPQQRRKRPYDEAEEQQHHQQRNSSNESTEAVASITKEVKEEPIQTSNASISSAGSNSNNNEDRNTVVKKLLPRGQSLTLLGTVTMQLNKDQKIKQCEVTFAFP